MRTTSSLCLSVLLVCIASACLGATLRVAAPEERHYRTRVVRARWVEIGNYQYFLIDAQSRSGWFAKDRGRTVQILLRVPRDRSAKLFAQPEGYAFWFTTWFDKSGRIVDGTALRISENGALMISGDVRVRISGDAGTGAAVQSGLTSLAWQSLLAEHDPSMASPLLAPLWLEVEPTLLEWQRDLDLANVMTRPEE